MENGAVARIFGDIADLLELKGENAFKIRAYQRAARTIEYAPASLERLRREGRLRSLPGIGEAVAQVERLGEKTAQNILLHLQSMRRKGGRIPLGEAEGRVRRQ